MPPSGLPDRVADQYELSVQRVALCLRAVQGLPIEELLQAIDRADAVAPFFAPELWIRKRDAMREDREMLQAALPLKRLADKLTAAGALKG